MEHNILYRASGYCQVAKEALTFDFLAEWFIAHLNDYVYVVAQGRVIGVVSGKTFENRLRDGQESILIEQDFPFLTEASEENRCAVYQRFQDDLTLQRLPVLQDGVLLGEYYDSMKYKENTECYHIKNSLPIIKPFTKEVAAYFVAHQIHDLVVLADPDVQAYLRPIFSQFKQLTVSYRESYLFLQKVGEAASGATILDLKYPDEYRTFYKEKLGVSNTVLLIFDVMAEVLLDLFQAYCQKNDITFVAAYAVGKQDISCLSPNDKGMMSKNHTLIDVLGNRAYLKKFYRKNPSFLYATSQEVGPLGERVTRFNGIYNYIMDAESEYINTSHGIRRTAFAPAAWQRELHFFGPCIAQGICVTDDYTIESYLQKALNRAGEKVKVVNHGAATHTPYASFCNDFLSAMDAELHAGDIVLFLDAFTPEIIQLLQSRNVPLWRDNTLFDGTANYFMNNTYHCNHLANQRYARFIHQSLQAFGCLPCAAQKGADEKDTVHFFRDNQVDVSFRDDAFFYNRELCDYQKYLTQFWLDGAEQMKIGAICTQANPFTKGHLALVQWAAAQMDHVYVFVVQDSLHALPYLDRMDIVLDAVKALQNVTVLTCGTYFASYRTFPDYFTVAKYKNSFDVESVRLNTKIFAEVLCAALAIEYRFLGEEPNDNYTNQFIEYLQEVLPSYGIQPMIMKRALAKGGAISASVVREKMKRGEPQGLEEYATPYALAFLKKYYK